MTSRYVVGLDLGTTNCALAAADTGAATPPQSRAAEIPQVVAPGQVESRGLLPSFLYLPGKGGTARRGLTPALGRGARLCRRRVRAGVRLQSPAAAGE